MSSGIQNFAETGFHEHRAIIGPMAAYGPAVVEGGILMNNIRKDPAYFKEKIKGIWASVKADFTQQEGEFNSDFKARALKNGAALLFCLVAMGAVVTVSSMFLPANLAATVALPTIYFSGKIYLNRVECAQFVKESFTTVENKEKRMEQLRVLRNTLFVAGVAILLGFACHYAMELLNEGFDWERELPFQSDAVVFGEYSFLGAIHAALAYKRKKEGNLKEFTFHCVAAILSIAFPAFYLMGGAEMRLHHSFIGLALMAIPSRVSKYIGSIIVFDSSLYAVSSPRGFYNSWGGFEEYDFMNTVVDNYDHFAYGYSAAFVCEDINKTYARDHANQEGSSPADEI